MRTTPSVHTLFALGLIHTVAAYYNQRTKIANLGPDRRSKNFASASLWYKGRAVCILGDGTAGNGVGGARANIDQTNLAIGVKASCCVYS